MSIDKYSNLKINIFPIKIFTLFFLIGLALSENFAHTTIALTTVTQLPKNNQNKDCMNLINQYDSLIKFVNEWMGNWKYLPQGLPVEGNLTDGFGLRFNPFGRRTTEFHSGQDVAVPYGTSVHSTAKGIVAYAGWKRGYGKTVVIDHGNGTSTLYAHLSKIAVCCDQKVRRGEEVGYAGSTGRSTGIHVHYEIRYNNVPVDPLS